MQRHYIQDQHALVNLCQVLNNAEVLAIDTEFVRTRTLYPKLGLLQISDGHQLALIDPVTIDDLTPFWQLLENKAITKVLHACSEDLEVFLTSGNCRPVNLIDSQVMMMFLGHGLSLGYAAMVKHFLDIDLDKSESRTDWIKRPLTEKQLNYAQADVEYLIQIYPTLLAQIKAKGWLKASQQESELMIIKKFTPIDEEQLYRNIKLAWKLNPKQLNILKHLAKWRYQKAKIKDQPLSFIAKDHTLQLVAQYEPNNVGAMAHIDGVETLDVRHQGKAMVNVIKQAGAESSKHYPKKIIRLDEYPNYKQTFKKVKQLVATVAKANELSAESVASKKQINQFLSFFYHINEVEQGASIDVLLLWRKDIIGNKLLTFAQAGFKD